VPAGRGCPRGEPGQYQGDGACGDALADTLTHGKTSSDRARTSRYPGHVTDASVTHQPLSSEDDLRATPAARRLRGLGSVQRNPGGRYSRAGVTPRLVAKEPVDENSGSHPYRGRGGKGTKRAHLLSGKPLPNTNLQALHCPSPTRCGCGLIRWLRSSSRAPHQSTRGALDVEPKDLSEKGERLEDRVWRLRHADLVRVLAEQHRDVDGVTAAPSRQVLDLALVAAPAIFTNLPFYVAALPK
jgi:hypothetical protein